MAHAAPTRERVSEPTIGRLVADASRDLSFLIRSEIALAKAELRVTLKTGGTGLALLGVAAFVLLLAVILLSFSIAFFVAMIPGINLAFAFLIVFAVYALIGAVVAMIGLRKLKRVGPPERAITQAQRSKEILHRDGP